MAVSHKVVLICDRCGDWVGESDISVGRPLPPDECVATVKKVFKKTRARITNAGRVVCKKCRPLDKRHPNWSK
jgi:hypothetical protein